MLKAKHYRIIGMMSGTSLDGVDLAFCSFTSSNENKGWNYNLIAAKTYPYTPQILSFISKMQQQATSFLQFKELEIKYSRYISGVIKQFINEEKIQNIDYISIHGHTIFHQPDRQITVQIGNLSTIAAELHLNVIGNFRQLDVMRGGEGAPLAPFGQELFGNDFFLNFGGIVNIGYEKRGWDINLCNLVFNYYSKLIQKAEFDRDGKIGMKGKLNQNIAAYLKVNYANKQYKSLGRQNFQQLISVIEENFKNDQPLDILHTFYHFLAEEINRNVKIMAKDITEVKLVKVFCTGGGAKNIFLLNLLRKQGLDKIQYLLPDDKIIQFKEAIIFAYLGLKFIQGIPNCNSGVGGMLVKGQSHSLNMHK